MTLIGLWGIYFERDWGIINIFSSLLETSSFYGLAFIVVLIGQGWSVVFMNIED
jgi:hypothetical protein